MCETTLTDAKLELEDIQEIILGKNGPREIGTKRTNMATMIATPATNHEDQTVEMQFGRSMKENIKTQIQKTTLPLQKSVTDKKIPY